MPVQHTKKAVGNRMNAICNPIVPTIDLEADGVHHGHLRLPYSRDDSAWGSILIPITKIKNGSGPTALLSGGNHGDEYEGPIALHDLCSTVDAGDIQGRLLIIPGMNFPAVQAATRTSPIDRGNMNRIFPGRPDGSVTEKIADYFQRSLIPQADYVLDFHSGGKTLDFIPFAAVHILEDKTQQSACVAAMDAFGAPYSMMMLEMDNVGMYDTAVEDQGKIFVTTELGGGGRVTVETVTIAKRGVRNFLVHAGILAGEIEPAATVRLAIPEDDCFHISRFEGMFEPMVELGENATRGEPIGRVWSIANTGRDPDRIVANRNGVLAGRHFPGLIKMGDCAGLIAEKA